MPRRPSGRTPSGELDKRSEEHGMTGSAPSASPPSGIAAGGPAAGSRPRDLSAEEVAAASRGRETAPTLPPPREAYGRGGITAWQNDKRVTALWSINENRNAWVGFADAGWKKLANNSDSAIVALNMLSASAKQTQSSVNYREESDGMIYEIYVW